MIRKMLEAAGFKFTDDDFKKVMDNATKDIKDYRVGFKKKTSINGVLIIAERCCLVLDGIKKAESC